VLAQFRTRRECETIIQSAIRWTLLESTEPWDLNGSGTLLCQQVPDVFRKTAPQLVQHNQSVLFRAHLEPLRLAEASRTGLVLQVASDLPDVVPDSRCTLTCATFDQPKVRQLLLSESFLYKIFLNFDLVHLLCAVSTE